MRSATMSPRGFEASITWLVGLGIRRHIDSSRLRQVVSRLADPLLALLRDLTLSHHAVDRHLDRIRGRWAPQLSNQRHVTGHTRLSLTDLQIEMDRRVITRPMRPGAAKRVRGRPGEQAKRTSESR